MRTIPCGPQNHASSRFVRCRRFRLDQAVSPIPAIRSSPQRRIVRSSSWRKALAAHMEGPHTKPVGFRTGLFLGLWVAAGQRCGSHFADIVRQNPAPLGWCTVGNRRTTQGLSQRSTRQRTPGSSPRQTVLLRGAFGGRISLSSKGHSLGFEEALPRAKTPSPTAFQEDGEDILPLYGGRPLFSYHIL